LSELTPAQSSSPRLEYSQAAEPLNKRERWNLITGDPEPSRSQRLAIPASRAHDVPNCKHP